MDNYLVLREVARSAHESINQKDKSGKPYWEHPWRVAELVQTFPSFAELDSTTQSTVVSAAYLHDVLEDTPILDVEILAAGASPECLNLVKRLTKPEGIQDLTDYYFAIRKNTLARIIKLADIADNTNVARQSALQEQKRAQLQAKYEKALTSLGITEGESRWLESVRQLPVPRELS